MSSLLGIGQNLLVSCLHTTELKGQISWRIDLVTSRALRIFCVLLGLCSAGLSDTHSKDAARLEEKISNEPIRKRTSELSQNPAELARVLQDLFVSQRSSLLGSRDFATLVMDDPTFSQAVERVLREDSRFALALAQGQTVLDELSRFREERFGKGATSLLAIDPIAYLERSLEHFLDVQKRRREIDYPWNRVFSTALAETLSEYQLPPDLTEEKLRMSHLAAHATYLQKVREIEFKRKLWVEARADDKDLSRWLKSTIRRIQEARAINIRHLLADLLKQHGRLRVRQTDPKTGKTQSTFELTEKSISLMQVRTAGVSTLDAAKVTRTRFQKFSRIFSIVPSVLRAVEKLGGSFAFSLFTGNYDSARFSERYREKSSQLRALGRSLGGSSQDLVLEIGKGDSGRSARLDTESLEKLANQGSSRFNPWVHPAPRDLNLLGRRDAIAFEASMRVLEHTLSNLPIGSLTSNTDIRVKTAKLKKSFRSIAEEIEAQRNAFTATRQSRPADHARLFRNLFASKLGLDPRYWTLKGQWQLRGKKFIHFAFASGFRPGARSKIADYLGRRSSTTRWIVLNTLGPLVFSTLAGSILGASSASVSSVNRNSPALAQTSFLEEKKNQLYDWLGWQRARDSGIRGQDPSAYLTRNMNKKTVAENQKRIDFEILLGRGQSIEDVPKFFDVAAAAPTSTSESQSLSSDLPAYWLKTAGPGVRVLPHANHIALVAPQGAPIVSVELFEPLFSLEIDPKSPLQPSMTSSVVRLKKPSTWSRPKNVRMKIGFAAGSLPQSDRPLPVYPDDVIREARELARFGIEDLADSLVDVAERQRTSVLTLRDIVDVFASSQRYSFDDTLDVGQGDPQDYRTYVGLIKNRKLNYQCRHAARLFARFISTLLPTHRYEIVLRFGYQREDWSYVLTEGDLHDLVQVRDKLTGEYWWFDPTPWLLEDGSTLNRRRIWRDGERENAKLQAHRNWATGGGGSERTTDPRLQLGFGYFDPADNKRRFSPVEYHFEPLGPPPDQNAAHIRTLNLLERRSALLEALKEIPKNIVQKADWPVRRVLMLSRLLHDYSVGELEEEKTIDEILDLYPRIDDLPGTGARALGLLVARVVEYELEFMDQAAKGGTVSIDSLKFLAEDSARSSYEALLRFLRDTDWRPSGHGAELRTQSLEEIYRSTDCPRHLLVPG